MNRQRIAVALLTVSAVGFGTWKSSESFTDRAVIPTKGDVPTLGYGSTRYEDGRPVRMGDRITRDRAEVLARNLMKDGERKLADSLPGVKLYQEEFDVYVDFVGQFGIGNWRASSMRKRLLAANYAGSCDALLLYRYSASYDCSTPGNRRCAGVWTRQLRRHERCMGAQ